MLLGCDKILSATELERYRVRLERTLPVKGKKEFAPSGSWVERKQLEAAQDERHALLKEERVERVGTLSVAEWDEKMNVAVVTYSIGKHWENFGHQQGQIKCLNPEEALFLLETSNLLLLHNNVGLSVQQAYNTLIGQRTGCTLDCYRAFSHLARQGFRLKRHDGPIFILTEYERRIGLESYLYRSKRGIVNMQDQPNDQNGDSLSAECPENTIRQISRSSEGNDEIATNYMSNQHADILSENHVKTENQIPQASEEKLLTSLGDEVICSTVKTEVRELQTAHEFGFYSNNTVLDSTGISSDICDTNFKSGKQHLSNQNSKDDVSKSHQRIESSSEIIVSKTSCSSGLVKGKSHNVKHEQGTDNFSYESVNNENRHGNKVGVSDVEIKVENCLQKGIIKDEETIILESASTESSLKDVIKKDFAVTENSCDISMDSTDSPNIIESLDEGQESDKHLNNREPQIPGVSHDELIKKENLKTSHEVCLISDSSVSGFSDVIIDHEEQDQNKTCSKTHHPPVVNLASYDENKLCGFQSKAKIPHELVIIDELPVSQRLKTGVGQSSISNNSLKCEIDITDVGSAEECVPIRTLNRKTVGGHKSFSRKKSLKCEIDIADVSSAEESVSACPDITSNKEGDDILCVNHKHKSKRKRRISQRKSFVKSEKSYVVDVETGTVVHSNENLVPRKVAKRERHKEIREIIVVDDIDTHCENNEAVELKDNDLELELTKFYEEITLIDLTGEDSRTKTRNEILDMFPNFAGVRIATVTVPPSDLLPENVTPSQQEYQIDLQNLLTDRPNWIVRRRPYRGRDAYQRFNHRRGYYRRQQYHESPHRHIADERNYVDPQVMSEEFSRNVRMDYDEQSVSQNYYNTFNHQAQEKRPFAIDTSGDFSKVKRFEHQQRIFPARSNKQWYERTWNTGSQSDGFMHHSDSPSASPQHYERMEVDNRFAGHRHNQHRWNTRYNRNTTNRRNPRGRSKFRSFHHPASHRQHTTRTDNSQEQSTEHNWQNIRNVSENAENWSDLKKLVSGKNCEEPSVEPKVEAPMKVEEIDDDEEEEEEDEEKPQVESMDEEAEDEDVEWKPLLQPSDCTDIGSILKKLNVFKEIPCDRVQIEHVETKVKINYDVYLPSTKFKKSAPCLPDYRLCIIGCEEEVPTAGEISFLLKDLRDDVPLLFAVVVPDSVAFYHFVNISLPVDDSCPI